MKKNYLLIAGLTIAAALIFIWLFNYLSQIFPLTQKVQLVYWGWFIAALIVGSVIFRQTALWEIHSGKLYKGVEGPANDVFLFSSLFFWVGVIIAMIMLISGIISLSFPSYDLWLGEIWWPLAMISGWTSIESWFVFVIILCLDYFLRFDACYEPSFQAQKNSTTTA